MSGVVNVLSLPLRLDVIVVDGGYRACVEVGTTRAEGFATTINEATARALEGFAKVFRARDRLAGATESIPETS